MPLDAPDLLKERAHFSRAEARELGKSLRRVVARSELAERRPPARDAVAHLREQNADRVPELVPVRMARMLAKPVRVLPRHGGPDGAGPRPTTRTRGILVAACGDAHISNFGFYASPERQLVFDLNDFDEAAVAPWEWDVKRLITSVDRRRPPGGLRRARTSCATRPRDSASYTFGAPAGYVELSPGRALLHALNSESVRRG